MPNWRNLWRYLQAKNQLHPSCLPWDIAKILSACCFGYFGYAWLCTPKVALSTYRNPLCLSADRKSTSSPIIFWRYWKICKFLILGTLSMAAYTHPKWYYQLVEDFNLHAKNKPHHSLLSWDIIYILKNPAMIGWQHFAPYFQKRNFAIYGIGCEIATI